MVRKRKSDGLESKVAKFPQGLIQRDDEGTYIPICNYSWHRGIIQDEEVCQIRRCTHYSKHYFKGGNYIWENKK